MINLNRRLVLASESPRRLRIFRQVGLEPEVRPQVIDENIVMADDPAQMALRLAELKAKSAAESVEDGIVVGADTIVVLQDEIFGKPTDANHAAQMLRALSGKKHKVITAFCIIEKPTGTCVTDREETSVFFKKLSDEEISAYIEKEQPFDKAGSYGIQDSSALFIERIEGCYNNVVGFPIARFYEALQELKAKNLL